MQGVWWELKIELEPEEYKKLRDLAAWAGKDIGEFVCEVLRRFLKTSADIPSPSE